MNFVYHLQVILNCLEGTIHCPDVIVLSLAQAQTQWTALRKELLDHLIIRYMNPNMMNSSSVIQYIWNNCGQMPQLRELLKSAFKRYYKEEPTDQQRLMKIYDLARELKALQNLLKISSEEDFNFAIDLACLASRQNFLNLAKWLEEYNNNAVFISELRKYFLRQNMDQMTKESQTIKDFLEAQISQARQIGAVSAGPPGVPGPPPGVDLINSGRSMISPSADLNPTFDRLTNASIGSSPIQRIGSQGITPSPPTLQSALGQSGLGNFGNLGGLGGVNPSLPSYQDFSNNAVKELFSRGGALPEVSPTGPGLSKLGGVPGLSLDPQVPGFSMPNNFPSGGLLSKG